MQVSGEGAEKRTRTFFRAGIGDVLFRIFRKGHKCPWSIKKLIIADGCGKGEPGQVLAEGLTEQARGLRRSCTNDPRIIDMDTGCVPFLVPPYRCRRTDGIL